MRQFATYLFAAVTTFCLQSAVAQERHALLIGNESYSPAVGRLKNPINDVQLIAKTLAKISFKKSNIRIVENADRLGVLTAINNYIGTLSKAGNDAIGFFYYSGHGAANKRDKRNYLIPIGVKGLDQNVWFKSIALNDIVTKLSDLVPNAAHFIVFDACRNLLNAPTRGGKGFVPVAARRGMLIAFSTDPGETASDEGSTSGPYAAALAAELTKPGLDHVSLFQNVKEAVYRQTKTQVPWERNGLVQRVYLAGKPIQSGSQLTRQPSVGEAQQAWVIVKDAKNPAALIAFAERFKSTALADRALAMAKRINQSSSARISRPSNSSGRPDTNNLSTKSSFVDDFNGDKLSDDWQVLNRDNNFILVEQGRLLLVGTSASSMSVQGANNIVALKRRVPDGDWTFTANVQCEFQTGRDFFQIGLFEDHENFLYAGLSIFTKSGAWGNGAGNYATLSLVKANQGRSATLIEQLWRKRGSDFKALYAPILKPFTIALVKRGRKFEALLSGEGLSTTIYQTGSMSFLRPPKYLALKAGQTHRTSAETICYVDKVKLSKN